MKSKLAILLATCLMAGTAVSCIDEQAILDKISGLDDRITALEEQMRTANQNISGLQTITSALQKNVYVTSVTETADGYTIAFSDQTVAQLTNGKDGQNGEDGKDGATPTIGVRQDTDQIWYWTLNGDWLLNDKGEKMRVTGIDGKDGKDGADGKDGKDGVDGKDGKDGADAIAPQLKIDTEDNYWYISTDGGITWEQLQKAKGEDGDSWFKDVTWDDNFVFLTLADDTQITLRRGEGLVFSIAVVPDYDDGSVKAGTGLFTLRFKLNPATVAEKLLEYPDSCFKMDAVYTLTKASAGDFTTLPILKKEVSEEGVLTITTDGSDLEPEFFSRKLGVSAALFINDGNALAVDTGFFPLYKANEYMGHSYVDFGLESGLVWADTNLGAENPSDNGTYYAWGETTPKDYFSWENYLWYDASNSSITKYNSADNAWLYADYDYEDDPARAVWGGEWRTPTVEDWKELLDPQKVNWSYVMRDGVWGTLLTSKIPGHESESIFLPACGWMEYDELHTTTTSYNFDPNYPLGVYWTSQLFDEQDAFVLVCSNYGPDLDWILSRFCGTVPVRPVLGTPKKSEEPEPQPQEPEPEPQPQDQAVDLGLSVKWGRCNLGAQSELEFGDYFAWGETEPYYENGYAVDENALWKPGKEYGYERFSYRWIDGNDLTKYYLSPASAMPDKTVLDPEDDAATVILGEGWRMPTEEEIDELLDSDFCEWTPETIELPSGGQVAGFRITGIKTGESIFIPYAGHRRSTSFFPYSEGGIWTSTVNQGDDPEDYKSAIKLAFFDNGEADDDTFVRWFGLPIRPVYDKVNGPDDWQKAIEGQWYYYDGQSECLYDIGASYPGHVFWKEEPYDNDVLPTDQFSGKRYSLSELPDGGVKIYCEDEDWFYAFYRESKTTAKIQKYYPADYYSSEQEAYEWSGMHMTLQDLGWLAINHDLRLREPFQKLNWGQWVINADGNNYLLTGTDYDDFNHPKRFQEDIIGNHDCTLPIVRMNNYGEEKDYANVDVHGKIVVVDRGGGVTFFEKMVYASKAGAIAVMCANNTSGAVYPNMLGNLPDGVDRIPFVTITKEAGEKLNGQTTAHFIYTDDPDSIRY